MWTESNTPSKIEGAGGADVPKALFSSLKNSMGVTPRYSQIYKNSLMDSSALPETGDSVPDKLFIHFDVLPMC